MVELKVTDTIDLSKLKRIANTQRTILVGHEGKEAEIAKKLYFGSAEPGYTSPRGRKMGPHNIPARPYLTDGFLKDEAGVRDGVQHYYEGLFVGRGGEQAAGLASKIAQDVRSFVLEDNPYAETKPNAKDVIADKGFNHPLFDQGTLMAELHGKVVTNA